ncbi:hypothetical protein KAU34_05240 [candidate division WOR-3 bacterium]|nr:hypothetical protein [candidate division WOR-3 bacterium]
MRLDLFLKKIRVVRTRTKSKALCNQGLITLNNITAKPRKDVKPKDIIKIDFVKRILIIEAIKLPEGNVPKSEAASYYNIIKDEKVDII